MRVCEHFRWRVCEHYGWRVSPEYASLRDGRIDQGRFRHREKDIAAARLDGKLEEYLARIGFLKFLSPETVCKCLDELRLKRVLRLQREVSLGTKPPLDFDEFAPTLEEIAEWNGYPIFTTKSERGAMSGMVYGEDWTGILLNWRGTEVVEIPFYRMDQDLPRPKRGDVIMAEWRQKGPVRVKILKPARVRA